MLLYLFIVQTLVRLGSSQFLFDDCRLSSLVGYVVDQCL